MKLLFSILLGILLHSCYTIRKIQPKDIACTYTTKTRSSGYYRVTLKDNKTFELEWYNNKGNSTTRGTYTIKRNKIFLTSEFQPNDGFDKSNVFTVVHKQKIPNDKITVRLFKHDNQPFNGVTCVLTSDADTLRLSTDARGIVEFPIAKYRTIGLYYRGLFQELEIEENVTNLDIMMIRPYEFFNNYLYLNNDPLLYRKGKLYFAERKKWRYSKIKTIVLTEFKS